MTEEITMDRKRMESLVKKLGWKVIKINRHLKCLDQQGNIRIISYGRLKKCADNPKFFRGSDCNRSMWLKNQKLETTPYELNTKQQQRV